MVTQCKVTNKSSGPSVYKLSTGFRRVFAPMETRTLNVSELEELVQVPGGRTMIQDFLMIHDPEVLANLLNQEVENEYWLTPDKIPSWMESCSLDEFKDALDLAPIGTIQLIKDYAVRLPLNDHNKRQAMLDQLGFNVTVAAEAIASSQSATKVKKTNRRAASTIEKPVIKKVVEDTKTVVISKPEE